MSSHSKKIDRKGFLTLAGMSVGAAAVVASGRNAAPAKAQTKPQRERFSLAQKEPRSIARSNIG